MSLGSHIASDCIVRVRNHEGAVGFGTIVGLSRYAVVFEMYHIGTVDRQSVVLPEVLIRRGEAEIYSGRATVTDIVNTGYVLVVSADLMDPWSEQTGIYPGDQPHAELAGFVDEWRDDQQHVEPGFRLVVAKLRDLLAGLQPWIERCERMLGLQASCVSPHAVQQFREESWAAVHPALGELLDRFDAAVRQIAAPDLPSHRALACRELFPYLLSAPFLRRVYAKPWGHAEDLQLVDMMSRKTEPGEGTFGWLLNALCLTCRAARAYRDRSEWLKAQLALEARRIHYSYRRRFHVLCVGSAAAVDIRDFLECNHAAAWCRFHLLDFEPSSVEAAREYLQDAVDHDSGRPAVQLSCRTLAEVVRVAGGNAVQRPQFDFVYCAGGFDYLDDWTCELLLKRFLAWTQPGETVAAMILNAGFPAARWLEHLGHWHLRARNELEVRQWAALLRGCETEVRNTGPNLVFLARRGHDSIPAEGGTPLRR
ncbi:MAG: hypothetical protein GX575_14390 [Candidatus Anammoximicrobium sp.]|nr:hypothetical protein [Candidatus Anammoximicrobium sp.]